MNIKQIRATIGDDKEPFYIGLPINSGLDTTDKHTVVGHFIKTTISGLAQSHWGLGLQLKREDISDDDVTKINDMRKTIANDALSVLASLIDTDASDIKQVLESSCTAFASAMDIIFAHDDEFTEDEHNQTGEYMKTLQVNAATLEGMDRTDIAFNYEIEEVVDPLLIEKIKQIAQEQQ